MNKVLVHSVTCKNKDYLLEGFMSHDRLCFHIQASLSIYYIALVIEWIEWCSVLGGSKFPSEDPIGK